MTVSQDASVKLQASHKRIGRILTSLESRASPGCFLRVFPHNEGWKADSFVVIGCDCGKLRKSQVAISYICCDTFVFLFPIKGNL